MNDRTRDEVAAIAKLGSETLAGLVVVIASDAGYLELNKDDRVELLEAVIAGVGGDVVERFIANSLGESPTSDEADSDA